MFLIATGTILERKKKKKQCQAMYCTGKSLGGYCPKHWKQKQKYSNPARYHYDLLKSNAKRRKKEFTISFEYFKKFCEDTNYLQLKGKMADSLSIDRINDELGYVEGNIQVLTLRNNSRKEYVDWKIKFGRWVSKEEIEEFIQHETNYLASISPEDPPF